MNRYRWIFLFAILSTLQACTPNLDTDLPLSQSDTVAILQTALNHHSLVAEAALYLPGQSLKVVQNKVVKPTYRLTFNRQVAQLITINEEGREVREAYPQQFIVSFPSVKAIYKNTVILSMIVHSGNSTALYKMNRNEAGRWRIVSDQRGKF